MAMQVNGNYEHSRTDYAERVKEQQAVWRAEKAKEAEKATEEKKQQLEQQIRSASGDEKKIRELEKKLAQVENELSQKDNDTYRRQNTSVIRI